MTTAGNVGARTFDLVVSESGTTLRVRASSDGTVSIGDLELIIQADPGFSDLSAVFGLAFIQEQECCGLLTVAIAFAGDGTLVRGQVIVVPEPTSLSILILGLGMLGALVMIIGRRTRQVREQFVYGFG